MTAAGLLQTESVSAAGVAVGAAVHPVTAAHRLQEGQERENRGQTWKHRNQNAPGKYDSLAEHVIDTLTSWSSWSQSGPERSHDHYFSKST